MFVDETRVILRAGNGGNGAASFRREKFIPKGGPDGGDGGRGGDVVVECDENASDLREFYYSPHRSAGNGGNGMGRNKHGADGTECVLKVPPGTIIVSLETEQPVGEVLTHGEKLVVLHGGKGGIGNTHFKSSVNRAPRQFKPGFPGQTGEFRLVLKSIADLGLVGYPNAGKSTLTNMITNSRPKTAPYPFTTLHPNIGVIEYPDRYDRLKLADIPGLIEGAHENKGLGHRFLRHIERCKVLVLIIDMASADGRKPHDDYASLIEELGMYSPELLEKPRLVAANKMDEPAAAKHLKAFAKKHSVEVVPVSCLLGDGLEALKDRCYALVRGGV